MRLSDKTRRRLTLAIFLVLGPTLLAAVAGLVFFRRGSGAVWREESALSAGFGLPVRLVRVDYVRPEERRFYGFSFVMPETEQAILFIPEIESFPVEAKAEKKDAGAQSSSNNADSAADRAERFWRIPEIYLRASAFPELKRRATERTTGKTSSNFSVRFRAERITPIADDAEFDRLTAEYRPPKKRPEPRPEKNVEQFDAVNDSADSIEERVRRFAAEPDARSLDRVEGRFSNGTLESRLECSFRFETIPAMNPTRLSIVCAKSSGEKSVAFDTAGGPFPAMFLTPFLPVFETAGPSSWFVGKMEAHCAADGISQMVMTDSALFRAALEPAAARMTATKMSGQIARLSFDEATVRDGVFLGRGEIHLVRGTLDKRFFARLADALSLGFKPGGALSNKFPNDAVPFDQLQIRFEFRPDGAVFQSAYPSGIVGAYTADDFTYTLFLPSAEPDAPISYQRLLSTLADGGENPFWTPFYRDAMNHLPVEQQ